MADPDSPALTDSQRIDAVTAQLTALAAQIANLVPQPPAPTEALPLVLPPPLVQSQFAAPLASPAEYEWAAVLEYHTLFFNRHRGDMLAGSYDGWAVSDIGLLSSHVYPHRKLIGVVPKGPGQTSSSSSSSSLSRHRPPVDDPVKLASSAMASFPILPHADSFPKLTLPPPRPNSDPQINTAPVNTSLLPTVSSVLNEDAWTFYLRDYPDRNFVLSLIHIIRHGANLGFTGDKTSSQMCTNLKSAFDSPAATAALSADIAAQVANGRTAGPFLDPPFENFCCSPVGAITRKRSSKMPVGRRIGQLLRIKLVKERLAVIHTVLCWGEQLSGMHVIFHVDNDAVYNTISNFTIKS
ncbi:hypothetical protein C8R45DRAFT_935650 [Mycena sanguinolenta]|nr:hypothetical protein C8R45DRAFT_935650 [Mycena sanguinolenta]